MRLNVPYVAVSALGLAALPSVVAWGAAGHEIIATIAQMHLLPEAHAAVCAVLGFEDSDPPACHLASIATWADRVRMAPGMRWSASLHYVGAKDDYPSRTCAFPGDKGWAGREHANVLGAVRNTTDILVHYADSARGAVPDALAEEALKFLVHFIGDLHMPLHLTGRDRGGNGNKVRFDGRVTNLHSVWDSRLLAKALRTVPRNYTVPLPDSPLIERALRGAIYDPYVRRIAWEYLSADGAWAPDVPRWLACPTPEAPHPGAWGALQRFAGLAPAPAAGADTDDGAVCPYAWSAAIHPLNCEVVWPAALDTPSARHAARAPSARDADTHGCGHAHAETAEQELAAILGEERDAPGGPRRPSPYIELDTPEYAGVIAERLIMERLMAQGGIRLAAVLNWLFVFPDGADRRAMGVPSVA